MTHLLWLLWPLVSFWLFRKLHRAWVEDFGSMSRFDSILIAFLALVIPSGLLVLAVERASNSDWWSGEWGS